MIFFMWILFSVIVGIVGIDRKIGFMAAFFLSLLLSPLIGIIITLTSKTHDDAANSEFVKQHREKSNEEPTIYL